MDIPGINVRRRAPTDGFAPWLARPDWAAGRIKSSDRATMWIMWGFALVWNAIGWPAFLLARAHGALHGAAWLIALFPAAGLFLIALAWKTGAQWRRFGETTFEMAPVPGVIGGALTGTVRFSRFVRTGEGFRLQLRCIRRTQSRGRHNSSSEFTIWEDERGITRGGADSVPVAFYIPPECLPTSPGYENGTRILWRLHVSAKTDDGDYATQFEVPVFKTDLSPEQAALAARIRSEEQAEVAHYERPATSRIAVTPSAHGGVEFGFPAARNPGAAVGMTVFLAIWSAILVVMIKAGAPTIFPIVFGLFEVGIAVGVFRLWFLGSRVVVERGGVTITRTALGWSRSRTIPAGDITQFKTVVGMTAGNTVYTDLKLVGRDGKETTVAGSIEDHLEAEWLAGEMAKALGG